MAGLFGYATPSPIQLAATTGPLTLVQLVAPSNHRVIARRLSVSFNGNTASQPPVLIEVLRQSSAGTMSSLTPVKENAGDDESLQTTAQHTVADINDEPNAGDVLWRDYVHVMSGLELPIRDIPIVGGGRLAIRYTSSGLAGTVNVVPTIRFEE